MERQEALNKMEKKEYTAPTIEEVIIELEEIKDEYAKEIGFETWRRLLINWSGSYLEMETFEDEVSVRYARECCIATQKVSAENAKMKLHCGYHKTDSPISYFQSVADNIQVDEKSITNPDNIVLL